MTPKEFAKKIIASINPGTADISGIGDGTIKGAISEQNKNLTNMKTYQIYNFQNTGFIELYYQDGYLCCKINGNSISKFKVDAWG